MYAVIETGGKQYRVAVGDRVSVERLGAEDAAEVVFDRVLLVSGDDGDVRVGNPFLKGATVTAEVLKVGRKKKIRGLKYKPKVNYRVRFGHRQAETVVRVSAIQA